jgi:hypothetical protein
MARNRPTIVFVMAILNMVFGALGFLTACCAGGITLFMQFVPFPPAPWNPKEGLYKPMIEVLDQEAPNHLTVQVVSYGLSLLLAALLIVAGIGLIRMHGWARVLTILTSLGGIVVLIGTFIYGIIALNPAMHKAQAALMESTQKNMAAQGATMPNMNVELGRGAEITIGAVTYGIPVAYCVVAIVTMLLPSVSRAFAGTDTTATATEDYYDQPRS